RDHLRFEQDGSCFVNRNPHADRPRRIDRRSGSAARIALHSSLRTLSKGPFVNDPIAERVRIAVTAALDKKAFDLDVLSVGGLTSIADYFILASASNERQAQAIADSITSELREQLNVKPLI